MKIFYKETDHVNYSKYEFPYCIYCNREITDLYADIYNRGFLPYTNNLNTESEIYYLARSIRIDLTHPLFNYKQNTVFNQFEKIYNSQKIDIQIHKKEELINNGFFRQWCLSNAKDHFLNPERLSYILSRPYLREILSIQYENRIMAYIFIVTEGKMIHLWYSFYDLTIEHNNFGKWIILQILAWSQRQEYQQFFIGTCYSKSAFYKLTLSPNTQYYDGIKWNDDVSGLKKRLLMQ